MKVVRIALAIFLLGWMAYATWSLEVTRRNSERATATASNLCGVVYQDLERRSHAEGQRAPAHPHGCDWID